MNLHELVDLDRYKLHDPEARAALVARCRAQLAEESCVVLPGFVPAEIAARMALEVAGSVPRAHRRDAAQTAYAVNPLGDSAPEGHVTRLTSPFRQHVLANDLIPDGGEILALYHQDELVRLIAEILDQPVLYRTADDLLSCTATAMANGDEHGWHFDSNDFVVSLLLQAPEGGGAFEFAPYVRGETEENFDAVEAVMSGRSDNVRAKKVEPGTLMVFCGRRALHRVSPIQGAKPRLITLFCYDRQPGMQFSDSAKLRSVGRTKTFANGG